MSSPATETPKYTNRLAGQSSPYLLQHRHNPVDWYPWGPAAFEAARAQDKPIFLSVGYSTCYWCHVMERQSFENEAVAGEMNLRFINIKVDREERPDVDALYMTAVQVLTHQGGWPMSVFLTPDLRPFYGGTYYPPTDAYGRPGFVSLVRGIEDAYRNRKGDVEKTAGQLVGVLRRLAEPPPPERPVTVDRALVDRLVERSVSDYEPHFGGFGHAPKFPRETLLELLLTYLATDTASQNPNIKAQIQKPLRHTLDAMAYGGIRDQLGGGFHRYSTDAKWLVPHFEIMLYDNAMLGWVYAEAFGQTQDRRYAEIARGVFDFILREMTSPEGAFYTAFDAEVDAQEGLSYLWTKEEIESVLGPEDAKRFNRVYGVDRGPNFADPHHGTGTPDKSILFLVEPGAGDASVLFDPGLRDMRQKLYEVRRGRKPPLLDTKILTSWNALMIRALAHGGQVLQEPRYVEAARRGAQYLLDRHRRPDGSLLRATGGGNTRDDDPSQIPNSKSQSPSAIPGFLDDYAFFAQALLALADATGDRKWRDEAVALAAAMQQKFGDETAGGFYFTDEDATDLIVRQMTASDSPLPSGNAVAAMVLLETGQAERGRAVLATFAAQLENNAEGMSSMVQAALLYLARDEPFTVSAAAEASAEDRPLSPQQVAEGVVAVKPHWAGPTELHLRLSILRGFHINAHDPSSGDVPLIPTNLTVTDGYGAPADLTSIDYPPGEEQAFGFVDKPIRGYAGDVLIAVRFKAVEASAGSLRLSLSYQACNENACLPPVTKTVEVKPK